MLFHHKTSPPTCTKGKEIASWIGRKNWHESDLCTTWMKWLTMLRSSWSDRLWIAESIWKKWVRISPFSGTDYSCKPCRFTLIRLAHPVHTNPSFNHISLALPSPWSPKPIHYIPLSVQPPSVPRSLEISLCKTGNGRRQIWRSPKTLALDTRLIPTRSSGWMKMRRTSLDFPVLCDSVGRPSASVWCKAAM